jgi:tetratricopeptide (TPR) repeat protein
MRKSILTYIGCACLILGTGAAFADNVPTSGGKPAFATKADVMLSTIQSFIQAKDYKKAESVAEELTEVYSNYPSGWMILGYTRMMTGDFQGSNLAYEQAVSVGADKGEIQQRLAYNYIKMQDWENAAEIYETILERDATDVDALVQYASIQSQLDRPDEAVVYFKKALEIDPSNIKVITMLAKVGEKQGMESEVRFWLQKGLEIDPENPKLLKKYSVLLLNDQKHREALPYLEKLIDAEPDNASAFKNLGIAFYSLDRKKDAKGAFEKARELGAKMNGTYGPLAESYRATGDRINALAVVKEGISAQDQQAWLYCIWGKLLEDAQDFDGALAKFRRVAEFKEKPWNDYANKEIARQLKLKKRAELMAAQAGVDE